MQFNKGQRVSVVLSFRDRDRRVEAEVVTQTPAGLVVIDYLVPEGLPLAGKKTRRQVAASRLTLIQ